ncbi:MAG: hypothetical protein NT150_00760 [Bacteroidetes bacterium]|nr:hypothetical protein [Bacteroidota bacterium]
MKTLSLFIVSICLFQLSNGQHLLTDQPLVLNPSFAGSENVARFNLARTFNGTYIFYDQFIPKLKGSIGISAETKSAGGIYGTATAIYSPKFTTSKKYTFAPSLVLGYQNDFYGQYLVGKLGFLMNSSKIFAGAFIQTNYGFTINSNVHIGKKIEINKNMSLSIVGFLSNLISPVKAFNYNYPLPYKINQQQISVRMKYKSFKTGIGIIGEKIEFIPLSIGPPEKIDGSVI